MKIHRGALVALLLLVAGGAEGGTSDGKTPAGRAPADGQGVPVPASFVLDRGPGRLPLTFPDGERLDFIVYLDLGVLGETRVGTVVLTGDVEPYTPALPLPGETVPSPKGRTVGRLKSVAKGRYLNHSLDHTIDVRHLPQDFPRIFTQDTQKGSSNRKREQRIGLRDGKQINEYRRDHHCNGCKRKEHYVESNLPWGKDHHCEDCNRREHRVWKNPGSREVPEEVLDTLSSVFLARTFISEGLESSSFPLVHKDDLWDVTVHRGPPKVVSTPAGRFTTRKVELKTEVPAGEQRDDEFEGLFGIHGDIRIFMEETTGVPVVIEGDVPVGPFELKVRVKLRKFSGTPEGFGPLPEKKK